MSTRLHECCKAGDIVGAKRLIEAGSHDIDVHDNHGRTPLGCACFFGHREMVKFLVMNGACMHSGNTGVTPLHRAVCRDRMQIVKLLVAGGCDLNAKTNENETPIDWAKKFGRNEALAFLKDIEAHRDHLDALREELGLTDIHDNFLDSAPDKTDKGIDDVLEDIAASSGAATKEVADHDAEYDWGC